VFHDDGFWADLKANSPAEWADAVASDHAIRHGSAGANADGHPLRGTFYLHPSRVPLDQAVLRPPARRSPDAPGCGPWTCPRTPPADDPATTPTPPAPGSAAVLREVA
jgi:hypothetical protein